MADPYYGKSPFHQVNANNEPLLPRGSFNNQVYFDANTPFNPNSKLQVVFDTKRPAPALNPTTRSFLSIPIPTSNYSKDQFRVRERSLNQVARHVLFPKDDPEYWSALRIIFGYFLANPALGSRLLIYWLRPYHIPSMLQILYTVLAQTPVKDIRDNFETTQPGGIQVAAAQTGISNQVANAVQRPMEQDLPQDPANNDPTSILFQSLNDLSERMANRFDDFNRRNNPMARPVSTARNLWTIATVPFHRDIPAAARAMMAESTNFLTAFIIPGMLETWGPAYLGPIAAWAMRRASPWYKAAMLMQAVNFAYWNVNPYVFGAVLAIGGAAFANVVGSAAINAYNIADHSRQSSIQVNLPGYQRYLGQLQSLFSSFGGVWDPESDEQSDRPSPNHRGITRSQLRQSSAAIMALAQQEQRHLSDLNNGVFTRAAQDPRLAGIEPRPHESWSEMASQYASSVRNFLTSTASDFLVDQYFRTIGDQLVHHPPNDYIPNELRNPSGNNYDNIPDIDDNEVQQLRGPRQPAAPYVFDEKDREIERLSEQPLPTPADLQNLDRRNNPNLTISECLDIATIYIQTNSNVPISNEEARRQALAVLRTEENEYIAYRNKEAIIDHIKRSMPDQMGNEVNVNEQSVFHDVPHLDDQPPEITIDMSVQQVQQHIDEKLAAELDPQNPNNGPIGGDMYLNVKGTSDLFVFDNDPNRLVSLANRFEYFKTSIDAIVAQLSNSDSSTIAKYFIDNPNDPLTEKWAELTALASFIDGARVKCNETAIYVALLNTTTPSRGVHIAEGFRYDLQSLLRMIDWCRKRDPASGNFKYFYGLGL